MIDSPHFGHKKNFLKNLKPPLLLTSQYLSLGKISEKSDH